MLISKNLKGVKKIISILFTYIQTIKRVLDGRLTMKAVIWGIYDYHEKLYGKTSRTLWFGGDMVYKVKISSLFSLCLVITMASFFGLYNYINSGVYVTDQQAIFIIVLCSVFLLYSSP